MNKLSERIMAIVKEYNEKNERIHWKKISALLEKEASMQTIHRNLRQLVNNGDILEQTETAGRGVFKFFYIPTQDNEGWFDRKFDELNVKVDALTVKTDTALKILSESNER